MRSVAALVCLAAACAAETEAPRSTRREIVGGLADLTTEAVVGVSVSGACSGILVTTRVVVTSATCIEEALAQGEIGRIYVWIGRDGFHADRWIRVVAGLIHRSYAGWRAPAYDVGVLLLGEAVREIAPLPLNARRLDEILSEGDSVRAVGFGYDDGYDFLRQQATLEVAAIFDRTLQTTASDDHPCWYDNGGPLLASIDGVETVVGIMGFSCLRWHKAARVDRVLDEFISVAIDAWEGPCRYDGVCYEGCEHPDPDCDVCAPQGVCERECERPDWDCPIGGGYLDPCTDRYDCESRLCHASSYCTHECDPLAANPCNGLLCVDEGEGDVCVYPPPPAPEPPDGERAFSSICGVAPGGAPGWALAALILTIARCAARRGRGTGRPARRRPR